MVKKSRHSYDLQELLSDLLEHVPELRSGYIQIKAEMAGIQFSEKDYQELEQLSEIYGFPMHEERLPGMTIVFEDLLIPQLVEFIEQGNYHRLEAVMKWIERLSASEHFAVRNLVAVTICESFLSSYNKCFQTIFLYMGDKTKTICKMATEGLIIKDEIKQILKNDNNN